MQQFGVQSALSFSLRHLHILSWCDLLVWLGRGGCLDLSPSLPSSRGLDIVQLMLHY